MLPRLSCQGSAGSSVSGVTVSCGSSAGGCSRSRRSGENACRPAGGVAMNSALIEQHAAQADLFVRQVERASGQVELCQGKMVFLGKRQQEIAQGQLDLLGLQTLFRRIFHLSRPDSGSRRVRRSESFTGRGSMVPAATRWQADRDAPEEGRFPGCPGSPGSVPGRVRNCRRTGVSSAK